MIKMSTQEIAGGGVVVLSSSKRSLFSLREWWTWALNFHCSGECSNSQDILEMQQKGSSFSFIPKVNWLIIHKDLWDVWVQRKPWKPLWLVQGHHVWHREFGVWSVAADLLSMPYIDQTQNPNTQMHPEMLNSVKSEVRMRISVVVCLTALWRC